MLFNRRKRNSVILSLLACFGVQTTLAANQQTSKPANQQTNKPSFLTNIPSYFSNYVVTVSGGPAWTSAGKTQTFYVQSDVQNTYAANNKSQTLGTGELFLGAQHTLNERFNGQLGLAMAGSGMAKLSGQIWQDADADYNNFNYTYNINQFRLGLKGKLIAKTNPINPLIQPYVSGGVGVGFNRAFNYQVTPTIAEAVAAPGFTAGTTTALTYTLGAGIQKSFHTHWQIGMGYEFSNWGQSNLSRATGQTTSNGLRLNHLCINELQFSLSYIA